MKKIDYVLSKWDYLKIREIINCFCPYMFGLKDLKNCYHSNRQLLIDENICEKCWNEETESE